MSNFFQDENESEYMSAEEAAEIEQKVAAQVQAPQSYQETYQELPEEIQEWAEDQDFVEFSDEDLENDEELINDVSLRLEQGRLYQLILNHDLFKDIKAPPKAIANVQREIRQHVKSRLAILLGLKPDTQVVPKRQDFPFSDMEINLLKTLLVKLSNGATEKYKEVPVEVKKENTLTSITEKKPQVISPLTGPKSTQKIAVPSQPKHQKAAEQKAPVKAPVKTGLKTRQQQIKELEAQLEATSKPFVEMSPQEVSARNVAITKLEMLKKTPTPAYALPTPSLEQSNQVYASMASFSTENMLRGNMGRAINGK